MTIRDSLGETAPTRTGSDPVPVTTEGLGRGSIVGRYVLLDQLGAGGMGVVYSAYDPELDRQVALKLIRVRERGFGVASARQRLLREAQALAQLAHPNVVAVYDVGTFEADVFITMELVRGQTLKRWLATTERPLERRVEVLVAAGRGLAAAHAAGLVHRDFKPDNILIGEDGRVRVLDFGLARHSDSDSDSERADISLAGEANTSNAGLATTGGAPLSSAQRWDTPLTVAGSVLGTPAYMAPEQYLCEQVDAQSDQFSFCVTMFEALYGERPFKGDSAEELRDAVLGAAAHPPAGSRVPAWLRRIAMRGLSRDPADRYPDMAALLAELARDRRAARRRGALAAAGIALAGAAAFGLLRDADSASHTCRGAEERWAGVWDPTVSAAVRNAFQATGRYHAEESHRRVAAMIDTYAGNWIQQATTSCRDTRLRGIASERLLDARMGCLERRLEEARALVDLLSHEPDGRSVDKAVTAVYSLTPLAVCRDDEALLAAIPPPEDPTVRDAIDELHPQLARAEALYATGDYGRGRELATGVAERAAQLEYRPFEGEAFFLLARLDERSGELEAAEASLDRALSAAAEARDDLTMARCWIILLEVLAERGRYQEAAALRRIARMTVARAGQAPMLRAAFEGASARLHYEENDFVSAEQEFSAALQLLEQTLGPNDPQVASAANSLGNALYRQAKYEAAHALYQRARGIQEAALGPEHPDLAATFHNLAMSPHALGRLDEARDYYERGYRLRERAVGSDNVGLTTFLHSLGVVTQEQGDLAAAGTYISRALEIQRASLGDDHPILAHTLASLGDVHSGGGDCAAAVGPYEKAMALFEKAGNSPEASMLWVALAGCYRALERVDDAIPLYERALRVQDQLEVYAYRRAEARVGLSEALLDARREPARTRQLADEAERLLEAAERPVPEVRARLQRIRARLH